MGIRLIASDLITSLMRSMYKGIFQFSPFSFFLSHMQFFCPRLVFNKIFPLYSIFPLLLLLQQNPLIIRNRFRSITSFWRFLIRALCCSLEKFSLSCFCPKPVFSSLSNVPCYIWIICSLELIWWWKTLTTFLCMHLILFLAAVSFLKRPKRS